MNKTLSLLLFSIAIFSIVSSSIERAIGKEEWPPYPVFVTGTFRGHVSLGSFQIEYVLYQDVENELHEDYAAGFMMGAYINGTSYLSSPEGCQTFANLPFPFPSDLAEANNATFIGYEILLGDSNSNGNCQDLIVVQHWSIKMTAMEMVVYGDSYFEDAGPNTPAFKLIKSTMIGATETGGTYIFSFDEWDFSTPPSSVFKIPAECKFSLKKNQN